MIDVENQGPEAEEINEARQSAMGGVLARPGDVLPGVINLLPVVERPFFPSQVMPLVLSGEHWLETFKHAHENNNDIVGLVYCDAENAAQADPESFRAMGTACRIHQVHKQDDNTLHVVLVGVERFAIREWHSRERPFSARVEYFPEQSVDDAMEIKAYTTAIINVIKELLPLNPLYGEELKQFLQHFGPSDPARLADFGASLTTASANELQEVLETLPLFPRLEKALVVLQKELEIARAQMEIRQHVEKEMQERQREVFLREQLKFIQMELGISKDDRTAEVEAFRERIEELEVPELAMKRMNEELDKLSVLERGSPEYTVTRNYLDWLTILPWGRYSKDQLDLDAATKVLDADHEGLDDIKSRVKEFLGVGIMKGSVSGTILLLVGPPGVGKTSLGQSIARALGRRFYRFSLGGMRDEAEIKGHRRTYIGAMPGKFIQALKDAGTSNPVIMLDEVDKIGASYHGDPASALLEVLDPEQNSNFLDHYLDVRFDLSNVLFICTANTLDTIPAPLLDRMETMRLAGYLSSEKIAIARKHLFPRQLTAAGLRRRGDVSIDRAALRRLVEEYARESGVRRLDKLLARIVRKAVMKLLDGEKRPIRVKAADLEDYVDKPVFTREKPRTGIGQVTGLAWTSMGGATLTVEARRTHSFGRAFRFTGQLGDVMKESAEIAYSHILSSASSLGADPDFFRESAVHLHVPAGATPKDGPSAGITMACALLSLCRDRKPVAGMAMTGELTLTGEVLPVGGIREKVVAARRAGIKRLILPVANRGDFEV
ncbi:MAG: endopeptidase La, partial [Proteobacteria bacterium]